MNDFIACILLPTGTKTYCYSYNNNLEKFKDIVRKAYPSAMDIRYFRLGEEI